MMRGREMGFILRKFGITYAQFAEKIGGKSVSTIQRWVSGNDELKGKDILVLESLIPKQMYQEMRAEWQRLHPPRPH